MSFHSENVEFYEQDYSPELQFQNNRVSQLQEYPTRPHSTPAGFTSSKKRAASEAMSDDEGVDKKTGRRKIKIAYIEDKSRRHITFSKRKAGIMKKAYELSTLTGTQVLLLVASETGHVYTFATPKLQPLITKPEGKNLIQACLNRQDNLLPQRSQTPLGTSSYSNSYNPTPVQSPLPMRPVSAMSFSDNSHKSPNLQNSFPDPEYGYETPQFQFNGTSLGQDLNQMHGDMNSYQMYPQFQENLQPYRPLIARSEDLPTRSASPAVMMAGNPSDEFKME
jgi:hypothetical protein